MQNIFKLLYCVLMLLIPFFSSLAAVNEFSVENDIQMWIDKPYSMGDFIHGIALLSGRGLLIADSSCVTNMDDIHWVEPLDKHESSISASVISNEFYIAVIASNVPIKELLGAVSYETGMRLGFTKDSFVVLPASKQRLSVTVKQHQSFLCGASWPDNIDAANHRSMNDKEIIKSAGYSFCATNKNAFFVRCINSSATDSVKAEFGGISPEFSISIRSYSDEYHPVSEKHYILPPRSVRIFAISIAPLLSYKLPKRVAWSPASQSELIDAFNSWGR